MTIAECKLIVEKCVENPNEENNRVFLSSLNDPVFVDFLIHDTNRTYFNNVVKRFGLDDIAHERELAEENVVNNFTDFDIEVVKHAICGLVLGVNANRATLHIKTIKERANRDQAYHEKTKHLDEVFALIEELLSMDKNSYNEERVAQIIKQIYSLHVSFKEKDDTTVRKEFEEAYNGASDEFREELVSTVKESGERIFSEENKSELRTKDGKVVPMYTLANQNEKTAHFRLLVHTVSGNVPYFLQPNAREEYGKYMGDKSKRYNREYCPYSLLYEGATTVFSKGVIFGYLGIEKGDVWNATTFDGQTIQADPLSKERPVYRQEFLPIDDFLSQTKTYNEIALSNPGEILPDYIISYTNPPPENLIEIASNFGIPIVYIDREAYPESAPVEHHETEVYDDYWTCDSKVKLPRRSEKTSQDHREK